eukprot:6685947-Prorocentrum_lima.AAC.1
MNSSTDLRWVELKPLSTRMERLSLRDRGGGRLEVPGTWGGVGAAGRPGVGIKGELKPCRGVSWLSALILLA